MSALWALVYLRNNLKVIDASQKGLVRPCCSCYGTDGHVGCEEVFVWGERSVPHLKIIFAKSAVNAWPPPLSQNENINMIEINEVNKFNETVPLTVITQSVYGVAVFNLPTT